MTLDEAIKHAEEVMHRQLEELITDKAESDGAEMQVVINVPNWLYNAIQEHREPIHSQSLGEAVRDGTPLPKGHGRLIDAEEYVDVLNNAQIEGLNTYEGLGRAKELLIETHTIIEADKESEDKE